jgi:CubicO group peptidase (beta-lactamase class C family)
LTVLDAILADERHCRAQLYVSVGGGVSVDVEIVDGVADASTSRRRLYPLMSAAKPMLAVAAMVVCRDAGLSLDDRLVTAIPELTGQGRERIRLRDVLTHQTGFPPMSTHAGLVTAGWSEAFRHAVEVPDGEVVEPGGEACYQEWRYWYLLGELITRLTGRTVPEAVRTKVLQPLGLDREIVLGAADGSTPTDQQRGWRGGITTFGSVRAITALLAAVPGGPYFQPDGVFYGLPAVVTRWRTGMPDRYFSCVRDWGLGVMLESHGWGRRSVVFSPLASPGTYGHVARKGITTFVDPVHRIAVGILSTADLTPIETLYFLRSAGTAVYRSVLSLVD